SLPGPPSALGTLPPDVGAETLQMDRDGFSEQGAVGFGLTTGASTLDATRALVGARLQRQWQWGGLRFDVLGRLEWQRLLSQSGNFIDARFTGMDVWSPITGGGLQKEASVLGFGLRSDLPLGRLGFDLDARNEGGRTWAGAYANWTVGC